MKVCLIDAAAVNVKRFLPHFTPLGLAYIAATLERGGHEVLIIERDVLFRKNRLSIDKVDRIMEKRITAFGPDLIGLSSPSELFPDIVKSARIVKARFPSIPVVHGAPWGTHPTLSKIGSSMQGRLQHERKAGVHYWHQGSVLSFRQSNHFA